MRESAASSRALFLCCCWLAYFSRLAAAAGLAAHFCRRDGQLQAISYPGLWDGLSNGMGLTFQAWIELTDAHEARATIFSYAVKDRLNSGAESEIALELIRRDGGGDPIAVIRYKGHEMSDRAESSAGPRGITGDDPVADAGKTGEIGRPAPDPPGGAAPIGLGNPWSALFGDVDDGRGDYQGGPGEGAAPSLGASTAAEGYLVHVTATLDFSAMEYAVYLNGTRAFGDLFNASLGAPSPGGEFMLGADLRESSAYPGQLAASQKSCFTIDSFRVFDRALSETEVAASLPPQSESSVEVPAQGLLLSWDFDAPRGDLEEDTSGRGNHGRRGASTDLAFPHLYSIQGNRLQGQAVVPVVPPRMVMSRMPPMAGEAALRTVALVPAGAPADLELLSPASAGLLPGATVESLPTGGRLAYQNGTGVPAGGAVAPGQALLFTPPEEWPGPGAAAVSFLASAGGVQARGEIHPATPCSPRKAARSYVKQDEWILLRVGGVCDDGRVVGVELTEKPAHGLVFEVLAAGGLLTSGGMYHDLGDPAAVQRNGSTYHLPNGAAIRRVDEFPHALPPGTSAVLFVPFSASLVGPGMVKPVDSSVSFRWVSDYASQDAQASAAIRITHRNQPPVLMEPFLSMSDGGVDIQLRVTDSDGSPACGRGAIFDITRGPRYGTLKQVEPGADAAVRSQQEFSRFGMKIPVVEHSAKLVLDSSPAGNRGARSPNETETSARQDDLGVSSDSIVYLSSCTQCGLQSFVIAVKEPIYITEMDFLQLGVQSSVVTRIQASETGPGPHTQWDTVFESQGDELVLTEAAKSLVRFKPDVCQYPAKKLQYFRVEFDSDLVQTKVGFHSIKLQGSLTPRANAVWNEFGRLWYHPTPGIYVDPAMILDDFEVEADDCTATSHAMVVSLPPFQPDLVRSAGFCRQKEVVVELHSPWGETRSMVNVSRVFEHLNKVLGTEGEHTSHITVLISPPEGKGLELYQHDGTPISIREEEGQLTRGIDFGLPFVKLTDPEFRFSVHMVRQHASLKSTVHVLAFSDGVFYHMLMPIAGVCPPDTALTECATQEADCTALGVQAAFSPTEHRCTISSSALWSWFRYVLPCSIVALVLAVVLAIYWLMQMSRRGRAYGPPSQGEKVTLVITDIQGSTTLWERFPEQMAVDIALHHECLRASLKKCKGYEIATEGDSFKCAFRTPEDAICWTILAQMDMLCAPWTPALEDGGHSVLSGTSTWTNMEGGPMVSADGRKIINSITSSEVMEVTRTALRKGLIRQPLFHPQKVSDREFSREWVEDKGVETTCIHSSSPQPIPIFRGPRVRMGIHTGMAEDVKIHEMTKRYVYSGNVADTAKAVSDAPCGGQIIMSSETLAEVESLQELQAMVADRCAGWRHGEAADDKEMPAAVSFFSLGHHTIMQRQDNVAPASPIMLRKTFAGNFEEHDTDEEVAVDIETHKDACVAQVDERIMPDVGKATRLKDVHKKIAKARATVQSMIPLRSSMVDRRSSMDFSTPFVAALQQKFRASLAMTRTSTTKTQPDIPEIGQRLPQPHTDQDDMDCDSADGGDGEAAWTIADEAMDEFRHAHQLIMVVPWMLKTRAMYYPPPSTIQSLTPSWDMAPSAEGVTILFTFIESWQKLKAWNLMAGAGALEEDLKKLQAVVRYELAQHHGYEVEGEEGNFVCAFHTPVDAVPFAVAVQEGLLKVNWSQELLSTKWCHEQHTVNGELSFRGMRLAIGMCTGNALRVQPCIRTGKMEYYGPIMNHAARVATAAHGGQVLMHEATWQELLKNISNFHDDMVLFSNMGKHKLKGITKLVFVTQAIPKTIQTRAFPPIKTLTTKAFSFHGPGMVVGHELDHYLLGIEAIDAEEVEAPDLDSKASVREMSLKSKLKKPTIIKSFRDALTGLSEARITLRGSVLKAFPGLSARLRKAANPTAEPPSTQFEVIATQYLQKAKSKRPSLLQSVLSLGERARRMSAVTPFVSTESNSDQIVDVAEGLPARQQED